MDNSSSSNGGSGGSSSSSKSSGNDTQRMMDFGKGFVSGLLLASLSKPLLLGGAIGLVAGVYGHQEIGLPDVKSTWQDIKRKAMDIYNKSKSKS